MPKYMISIEGYGAEFVAGEVDKKFLTALKKAGISIEDYAENNLDDYSSIPENVRPFEPGEWFECDNIAHVCLAANSSDCMITVEDENGDVVYQAPVTGATEGPSHCPDGDIGADVFSVYDPGDNWNKKTVFTAMRNEKGSFYSGALEIDLPFDPENLLTCTCNFNERMFVNQIIYEPKGPDNCDDDNEIMINNDEGADTIFKDAHYELMTL